MYWQEEGVAEAPGLSPDFLFGDKKHPLFAFSCWLLLAGTDEDSYYSSVKTTARQPDADFLGLFIGTWTFFPIHFSF